MRRTFFFFFNSENISLVLTFSWYLICNLIKAITLHRVRTGVHLVFFFCTEATSLKYGAGRYSSAAECNRNADTSGSVWTVWWKPSSGRGVEKHGDSHDILFKSHVAMRGPKLQWQFFHDGLRSVCHLFKGKSILACRNTCQLPSRSPQRQNTLTGPISTPALETCSAFFAVGQPGLSTSPPGLKAKIYPVRGGSKL